MGRVLWGNGGDLEDVTRESLEKHGIILINFYFYLLLFFPLFVVVVKVFAGVGVVVAAAF